MHTTRVLDPIAPLAQGETHLAPRRRSLAGLSLAILSSEGPNGRELLEELADLLVQRAGVASVHHRSRHGGGEFDQVDGRRTAATFEPAAALAGRIDFAIAGVGL